MKLHHAIAASAALSAGALAQSPVTGINLRGTDTLFTSTTTNFVADYVAGAQTGPGVTFAIDWDASATTLWFIENDTAEYGTVDLTTGDLTVLGTSNLPLNYCGGLTCAPDGTWYAVGNGTNGGEIWAGDVTTGTFTLIGTLGAFTVIDVAADSQGNVVVHEISGDAIHSVDLTTGVATLIGGHGLAANFAQGIDFDWSNDTLYAAIYTGTGTGMFCSLSTTDGSILTMEDTTSLNAEMEIAIQVPASGTGLGSNYCTAVANSTGSTGVMSATGFADVTANNVTLTASSLPPNQFGIFVTSRTQGFVPGAGGTSNGNLCLSGSLGRFVGPGQILSAGATGSFSLALDLTAIPQGGGTVAVMAGETWNFQAWHRDSVGLGSNFTDGLQIDFQ